MFDLLGQRLTLEVVEHKLLNLNRQTHLLEGRKLLFADQKILQEVES